MKYRKIRCLTRIDITDDIVPCYRWRVANQRRIGSYLEIRLHRIPFFLTPNAHLIIEDILENMAMTLQPKPFSKITHLFYDTIHGLVSGYNMNEIGNFWRNRT